jgi:hypothetical protein
MKVFENADEDRRSMTKFVSYVSDETIEKDAQALLAEYVHARGPIGVHERASTFRTLIACQRPPRGVETLRALSASAMARKVVAPDLRISAIIGRTLLAARSASA